MKMYLISDNVDTLTGMRLAGVEGVVVHEKNELTDKDYPELVNKYKMESHIPLFIDIPDRHGTGRSENFITDYVNEAIGLKL